MKRNFINSILVCCTLLLSCLGFAEQPMKPAPIGAKIIGAGRSALESYCARHEIGIMSEGSEFYGRPTGFPQNNYYYDALCATPQLTSDKQDYLVGSVCICESTDSACEDKKNWTCMGCAPKGCPSCYRMKNKPSQCELQPPVSSHK